MLTCFTPTTLPPAHAEGTTNSAIRTITDQGVRAADDIADPVLLFTNGELAAIGVCPIGDLLE